MVKIILVISIIFFLNEIIDKMLNLKQKNHFLIITLYFKTLSYFYVKLFFHLLIAYKYVEGIQILIVTSNDTE